MTAENTRQPVDLNEETRNLWDQKAAFWDEKMGDGNAFQRLAKSSIDELIVTDTIPLRPEATKLAKLHVLSVAPLLGEAIRRTHEEASISSLFI